MSLQDTLKKRWGTSFTFGSGKVDDVTVRLEHVNLLNGLNRLHVELFKRGLQLFVVGAGPLRSTLDLATRCALST